VSARDESFFTPILTTQGKIIFLAKNNFAKAFTNKGQEYLIRRQEIKAVLVLKGQRLA
jgi:hypothetical protein